MLGCEVSGSADGGSGAGDRVFQLVEPLSNAEVGELGFTVGCQQNVGRLHIAMNDPDGVSGGECPQHLRCYPHGIRHVERSLGGEVLRERRAIDAFHDDVQLA